ncbi:hypothetical protein PSTT_05882 [Puccinia striiformis]|uniref:DUF7872 domain-containing protein n=1 Tax=Puccinia striiformis TaxID=27350 RepID=A0A2S4VMA5_9BASI|nr:hypothetical protein PSTT_05882 [Puccinia striiformis]
MAVPGPKCTDGPSLLTRLGCLALIFLQSFEETCFLLDPVSNPVALFASRLMNIVLARGDKVENTIYNAQTIGMKYSISAEYLTTSAWKCQTKQFLGILKKHSRNLSHCEWQSQIIFAHKITSKAN